ncbi:MAG TPA: hypothetical protein VGN86_08720 [Pyrinomonadaceae bacterium]|jgi:hypothetical protein|nr:hypothetical protein [Pyrinomonadaceae bacterium]
MNSAEQHIPFEELVDMVELPNATAQAARREHLAVCAHCKSEAERIGQTINLMRSDTSEDAPRDVIAYAVNVFTREKQLSLLRRIVAALSFDSASSAPAYGVRSGESAGQQQLYVADEHDIDVRISLKQDQWLVSGQILGSECGGGKIELSNGENCITADLNDLCEFTFPPVLPGVYRVDIRLADREIEIPKLELGV